MAVNTTTRTQYVAYGHVVGSQGVVGQRAADITYSVTVWDVDTGIPSLIVGVTPQREVSPDMEVSVIAPVGWPVMRSVLGNTDFLVLWPGGEKYATEECQ